MWGKAARPCTIPILQETVKVISEVFKWSKLVKWHSDVLPIEQAFDLEENIDPVESSG